MELAFLTPLLKNGAESISGGVTIDDKRFLKAWLSEDGGGADCVNKSVERGFVLIIPVKSAAFCAVGHKHVEQGGEHAEVADVHSVEIEKAEEGM